MRSAASEISTSAYCLGSDHARTTSHKGARVPTERLVPLAGDRRGIRAHRISGLYQHSVRYCI